MAETTKIDPITLRPGDIVTVMAEALDRCSGNNADFWLGTPSDYRWFRALEILSVEPREIRVGDRVRPRFPDDQRLWTVIALDGPWAWLGQGTNIRASKLIQDLELIP